MPSQNSAEFLRFLTRVWDVGVGEMRNSELLLLLGRKRLTPSVWLEVQTLWEEICNTSPLLVGGANSVWAFAYGEDLQPGAKAFFQDVRNSSKIHMN